MQKSCDTQRSLCVVLEGAVPPIAIVYLLISSYFNNCTPLFYFFEDTKHAF